MAMGREFLLPEHADSWGEFNARLERELECRDHDHRLTPLWWSLGGLLFGLALVSCAYAFQGHRWWLWLCMVAALAADLAMAIRALDRAEREASRRAELTRMQEAWEDHLNGGSLRWRDPHRGS
jgi:hypothetical protein